MAFKFRLQKILDLKEKEEDSKKNEVAKVLKEITEMENKIEKYKEDRLYYMHKREELNQQGCSVQDIMDINIYIQYLEDAIKKAYKELEKLKVLLKKKQNEYLEIRKERKSYDKLKEKHLERYKIDEAKKEEKVIDGIVTFANRKRG